MVKNKRGRRTSSIFGVENTLVKTWVKTDNDEWIYIGMTKKQTTKITSDGKYNYCTFCGNELKQEI